MCNSNKNSITIEDKKSESQNIHMNIWRNNKNNQNNPIYFFRRLKANKKQQDGIFLLSPK